MKTLDVLNKDDLRREYKLTLAFISRHSRELGGIGKPMIFDRELVEKFLREMMWEDERKRQERERILKSDMEFLNQRVSTIRSAACGQGHIIGRGGKGRSS